jgi:tRNA (guanosine-2'-O-)-methyltransferase
VTREAGQPPLRARGHIIGFCDREILPLICPTCQGAGSGGRRLLCMGLFSIFWWAPRQPGVTVGHSLGRKKTLPVPPSASSGCIGFAKQVFAAKEAIEVVMEEKAESKKSVRKRADEIKPFRCKHLIAVLENPTDVKNIGTVIRNVNALGVEKVYVVDPCRSLPDDWQDLRDRKSVSKTSVSAVKWTFVKRFDSANECFDYLERKGFSSIVTSPHVKGKASIFLHEGDYTAYTKLAVWFGSKSTGISNLAVERSEMCVCIPMFGMIESLNLGTSSGIVLYEVAKQRRDYQSRYRWRDQKGKRSIPLPTVLPPKA